MSLLKEWIPPLIYRQLKTLKPSRYGWTGSYPSWDAAAAEADGYDKAEILEKVRQAVLKVKRGEVEFERDSVLFDRPDYNWPLVAALLFAAVKSGGQLQVIDFGGSLGSTYFQNRIFFNHLQSLDWHVIEQPHFVKIGKEEVADDQLRFCADIKSSNIKGADGVLLLSSVLQYIEEPFGLLSKLIAEEFHTIIVDRMPFSSRHQHEICVQKVPPQIYNASYPCHLLSESMFTDFFATNNYRLHSAFDALDGASDRCYHKGFIFER